MHCIFIFIFCVPFFIVVMLSLMFYDPFVWIPIYIFYTIAKVLIIKRNEKFKHFFKKTVTKSAIKYYNKSELVMTSKIPQESTILGCHPHGLLCQGIMTNIAFHSDFDKYTILGSRMVYVVPFLGEIMALLGMQPVHASNLKNLMQRKQCVALVPGGMAEMTIGSSENMCDIVVIKKGFIKYSLVYGYKIIPVYTFGEQLLTSQMPNIIPIRIRARLSEVTRFPFLIPKGRFGIFPRRKKLITVVGSPINLPCLGNDVQKKDIEDYYDIYARQLKQLFKKYKHLHPDYEKRRMVIFNLEQQQASKLE